MSWPSWWYTELLSKGGLLRQTEDRQVSGQRKLTAAAMNVNLNIKTFFLMEDADDGQIEAV